MRATIRASVYGAGHMAGGCKTAAAWESRNEPSSRSRRTRKRARLPAQVGRASLSPVDLGSRMYLVECLCRKLMPEPLQSTKIMSRRQSLCTAPEPETWREGGGGGVLPPLQETSCTFLQERSTAEQFFSPWHPGGSRSFHPALVSLSLGSCKCFWSFFGGK